MYRRVMEKLGKTIDDVSDLLESIQESPVLDRTQSYSLRYIYEGIGISFEVDMENTVECVSFLFHEAIDWDDGYRNSCVYLGDLPFGVELADSPSQVQSKLNAQPIECQPVMRNVDRLINDPEREKPGYVPLKEGLLFSYWIFPFKYKFIFHRDTLRLVLLRVGKYRWTYYGPESFPGGTELIKLPFLEHALTEAKRLRHHDVHPLHVLWGILCVADYSESQLLEAAGLDMKIIQSVVEQFPLTTHPRYPENIAFSRSSRKILGEFWLNHKNGSSQNFRLLLLLLEDWYIKRIFKKQSIDTDKVKNWLNDFLV